MDIRQGGKGPGGGLARGSALPLPAPPAPPSGPWASIHCATASGSVTHPMSRMNSTASEHAWPSRTPVPVTPDHAQSRSGHTQSRLSHAQSRPVVVGSRPVTPSHALSLAQLRRVTFSHFMGARPHPSSAARQAPPCPSGGRAQKPVEHSRDKKDGKTPFFPIIFPDIFVNRRFCPDCRWAATCPCTLLTLLGGVLKSL